MSDPVNWDRQDMGGPGEAGGPLRMIIPKNYPRFFQGGEATAEHFAPGPPPLQGTLATSMAHFFRMAEYSATQRRSVEAMTAEQEAEARQANIRDTEAASLEAARNRRRSSRRIGSLGLLGSMDIGAPALGTSGVTGGGSYLSSMLAMGGP